MMRNMVKNDSQIWICTQINNLKISQNNVQHFNRLTDRNIQQINSLLLYKTIIDLKKKQSRIA